MKFHFEVKFRVYPQMYFVWGRNIILKKELRCFLVQWKAGKWFKNYPNSAEDVWFPVLRYFGLYPSLCLRLWCAIVYNGGTSQTRAGTLFVFEDKSCVDSNYLFLHVEAIFLIPNWHGKRMLLRFPPSSS